MNSSTADALGLSRAILCNGLFLNPFKAGKAIGEREYVAVVKAVMALCDETMDVCRGSFSGSKPAK